MPFLLAVAGLTDAFLNSWENSENGFSSSLSVAAAPLERDFEMFDARNSLSGVFATTKFDEDSEA